MHHSAFTSLFAIITALCAFVSASVLADPLLLAPRSTHNQLHAPHRRWIHGRRNAHASHVNLEKRQETTDRGLMQMDLDVWVRETTEKCMASIANITQASNPAGIVVCYNVPFLDSSTGVFAADLRMYQLSERKDGWESVEDINMSLEYSSAQVERTDLNTTEQPAATDPPLVQQFNFLGQIKPEFLRQGAEATELRALLIPVVSLTARTPAGTNLNTTLAMNEAAFVNGVFSELADNNIPIEVEAPPFELPGTRIEIVPIGLYIYTAYTIIGVGIFMWGTFERRMYRDQYRKRIAKN